MSEKNSEGISEVKAQGVLTTALGKSTTDRQTNAGGQRVWCL